MNIRTAILRAADHIEANPDVYDFWGRHVPECGAPGCALGWIGYFAGMKEACNANVSQRVLGIESGAFYNLMTGFGGGDWHTNAPDCARALRLYADKYFPEETTEEFPSIRAELDRIFEAVTC